VLWSRSLRRFAGVTERAPDIQHAAMRQTGRRILAGAFEGGPPPPPKVDPLLAALEASPAVRRAIGRLDISGATDADAWARVTMQGQAVELEIFYRHGREVAGELAAAAEALFPTVELRRRPTASPVLRQRHQGAWAAVFQLIPAGLSATRERGPIMRR
jgi:hypothetical protein